MGSTGKQLFVCFCLFICLLICLFISAFVLPLCLRLFLHSSQGLFVCIFARFSVCRFVFLF